MLKNPTGEELSRFFSYAQRIRRIVYSPHGMHNDCQDLIMLKKIWKFSKGSRALMFPNLRRLEFPHARYAEKCPDIFLATPSISLSLAYRNLNTAQSDNLYKVLEARSPGMQELDFGEFEKIEAIQESAPISSLICGMPNLRGLSCGPELISAEAIQHLAMLPYLRKLQIPCSSGDLLESIGPVLKDTKYFPELQVIELYEPKFDFNLSRFIQQNLPLRLQTINIVCNEITSAEALHAFLSALESGNNHTSLRNLTLQYRRSSKQRMSFMLNSKIVIDWSIIQPLLAFPNLTALKLDVPCTFELGDANLHDLAKAWPRIRSICLGFLAGWGAAPSVTLSGILDLLVLCPDIEHFFIPFSASTPLPSTIPMGASRPNITYLQVGNSYIGHPDQMMSIAKVLKQLFPKLCGIGGEWLFASIANTDKAQESWEEVLALTRSL